MEGLPEDRKDLRHRPPQRIAPGGEIAAADLHAGNEGRRRPRREHHFRPGGGAHRPRARRQGARREHPPLQGSRGLRRDQRHHHRRYEIRVRPRREQQPRPHRRSADRRFFALLAGRFLSRGHLAAFVRQAIRARLSRVAHLGQDSARAEAAGRRDRAHFAEVSRRTRTPDREEARMIGIVMGSTSDWETMKAAAKVLEEFGVRYEAKAMSAHRTPHAVAEWAAAAQKNGKKAIIAAAGGAAHLAGVVAAHTTLPVLGVPMPSKHLQGLDSLLSTVQMPKGIPVATFAIGEAGAANAALFAVALLALSDTTLNKKLSDFRAKQTEAVLKAAPLKL